VKTLKVPNNKDREHLIDEESCEYWDEHDSSDALEAGERIELEIARPAYVCERCKSSRIRRRIIDIPILSGKVVLKRIKTYYCADCGTSTVEEESLKELREEFRHLSTLAAPTLLGSMKEALAFHDKKRREKANERKVMSIFQQNREFQQKHKFR
jgi:ribosomal protein L37AE/L43A